MVRILIDSLPKILSPEVAVPVAYKEEVAVAVEKLRSGLSVLIECDKILVPYLFQYIRDAMREDAKLIPVDGNPKPGTQARGYIETMLANLRREITTISSGSEEKEKGEKEKKILVLPHLDLLTTATGSLTFESREAIAWLYENPRLLLLGFKDPTLIVPRVLENFFAATIRIVGLKRNALPKLVTQAEARKFSPEEFRPYLLYKYVSGLNVIRLRQILSEFLREMDSDGSPQVTEARLRKIRNMTASANFELPNIDMEQDIGGYEEVKTLIKREILDIVRRRDKLESPPEIEFLERLIPRGIIFWGPPGTGKTLFAKALASELEAAIIVVSGPELKSKYVGESEANIRQVFYQGRQNAPSVIVFDELDSIAVARGMYTSSTGVEHSMVNTLLTEMDGFRKEELVFVIGTTNFVESIDPALLRPGRFELHIHLPVPNPSDRIAIIQIYNKKYQLVLSQEFLDYIVAQTEGYTGDHLEALARFIKRYQIREGMACSLEIIQEGIDRLKKRAEPH